MCIWNISWQYTQNKRWKILANSFIQSLFVGPWVNNDSLNHSIQYKTERWQNDNDFSKLFLFQGSFLTYYIYIVQCLCMYLYYESIVYCIFYYISLRVDFIMYFPIHFIMTILIYNRTISEKLYKYKKQRIILWILSRDKIRSGVSNILQTNSGFIIIGHSRPHLITSIWTKND